LRLYELLFITRPDYDEEKIASLIARYTDLITKGNGIVKTAEKWGKRHLAYEINDLRDGIYILMTFEAEKRTASELDRLMKIDQEVLRHMISRIEPPKPKAQKAATQAKPDEQGKVAGEGTSQVRIVRETPGESGAKEAPKEPKVEETTDSE
jgi:small subunit ribosomal protein S6